MQATYHSNLCCLHSRQLMIAGPQGPKLLASAEERNGNDNPPGQPAAPEQAQMTAPAVEAVPDKLEPAEHRPEVDHCFQDLNHAACKAVGTASAFPDKL